MEPEQHARLKIDQLLNAAGWYVQDRAEADLSTTPGVAVRELVFATGKPNYTLVVGGRGIVEAKPEGQPLAGVTTQSDKYLGALTLHLLVSAHGEAGKKVKEGLRNSRRQGPGGRYLTERDVCREAVRLLL